MDRGPGREAAAATGAGAPSDRTETTETERYKEREKNRIIFLPSVQYPLAGVSLHTKVPLLLFGPDPLSGSPSLTDDAGVCMCVCALYAGLYLSLCV